MAKSLQELTSLLPNAAVDGDIAIEITSITHDSREVVPGTLFVCLTGAKADGHDYIAQARKQGAAAVLVEKPVDDVDGLTVITVKDTRSAMQITAPAFFDYPARKMRLIGVTGTNGKTTTTHILRSILSNAGFKVGLIGTIHTLIGDQVFPMKNTTPDVIDLQALLAKMVEEGMDYAVMEVSSHAVALNRIAGCEFDVGVFTNITRDHLDFHQTFENYIDAKAGLFRHLGAAGSVKTNKMAIINIDDPAGAVMQANSSCSIMTYGLSEKASLRAANIHVHADGVSFSVEGSFGSIPLQLKITGIFNVYNVLAAVGAALAEQVGWPLIKKALEEFESVPGRFELVRTGLPFSIIVDYAHTPDGLENILKTAREFAIGRILIVFGCGGDRDRTKRPIMGQLAVKYADIAIATSDNPRTEDPAAILQEIEVGMKQGETDEKQYEIIIDRKSAIKRALQLAGKQDIVIIAGKGHETYQILGNKTIHFDDREMARQLAQEVV
ncbi:MAG: murE 2 [Firmicutes bacterium]|nr:murE 2 [Bacillota bacterium]